jgi:hypothetical protein
LPAEVLELGEVGGLYYRGEWRVERGERISERGGGV